jgi:large subunit ribosomal protein L25
MIEAKTLKAEARTSVGTRASRLLRDSGRIPVVIYGHGEKPEAVSIDAHDFGIHLDHGAHVLPVEVGGTASDFLIKDIQYDYLGRSPIHLDLLRVSKDERIEVSVAIEFRGDPKGLSDGASLDQLITEITLECLLTNIPEVLKLDVSEMKVGESICVSELKLPDGVTTTLDPDEKIVILREAKAIAADEETEGEAGAAEPEVISKGKEDEESKSED